MCCQLPDRNQFLLESQLFKVSMNAAGETRLLHAYSPSFQRVLCSSWSSLAVSIGGFSKVEMQ